MLNYLYAALYGFRKEFSHKRTWLLFTVVVIGFIGSHEMLAITSFCRFWSMDHRGYYALIHFFHSTGWDLTSLMHHWFVFTLSQKCNARFSRIYSYLWRSYRANALKSGTNFERYEFSMLEILNFAINSKMIKSIFLSY